MKKIIVIIFLAISPSPTHASGTGHADSVPQSVHQDAALSSLKGERLGLLT